MRKVSRGLDELWQTFVFEGSGCLSMRSARARYVEYSFEERGAVLAHRHAISLIHAAMERSAGIPPLIGSWIMDKNAVADSLHKAMTALRRNPLEWEEDDDD